MADWETGIGSLASGIAKGLQLGESLSAAKQERQIQQQQADRQQQQWAQQDAAQRLQSQANAAGAQVINGARADYLMNGGTPDSWKPDSNLILKAMDARGDYLAKSGDMQGFTENEAKAASLRGQMFQQAAQDALAKYKVTGDATAIGSTVLPYIAPGYTLKEAKQDASPDGAGRISYTITSPSGKDQTVSMTPDELTQTLTQFSMAPGDAMKLAFQNRLQLALENMRAENRSDLQGQKNQGQLDVAKVKNDYSLGQIAARGAQARATKATPSAASASGGAGKTGANANIARTIIGEDGTYYGVHRNGEASALTDQSGNPIKARKPGAAAAKGATLAQILGASSSTPGATGNGQGAKKDYSSLWR